MIRTGWLAALALAVAPWTSFGQMGGMMTPANMMMTPAPPPDAEEWTVKIETANDRVVTGTLRLASVAIACDLGMYEIRPEKIREVQFKPLGKDSRMTFGMMGGQRAGMVLTGSGEQLSGTVIVPTWWKVRTDLGWLTPDTQNLRSLTFVARVPTEPGNKPTPPRPEPKP